jgi:hypothetical protein
MTFAELVRRPGRTAISVSTTPLRRPSRPAAPRASQDFSHLTGADPAAVRASWATALTRAGVELKVQDFAEASGKSRLADPRVDPKSRASWVAAFTRAGIAIKPPQG